MFNFLKRKPKIDRYCDYCDATLNKQKGFKDKYRLWICERCGYPNDVSSKNILLNEAEYILKIHKCCPVCNEHMYLVYLPGGNKWKCEECDYIDENNN